MNSIFQKDPELRPTAKNLLNHVWLKGRNLETLEDEYSESNTMNNLSLLSNYLMNNNSISELHQSNHSFSKSPKHQLFKFNSKKVQEKEFSNINNSLKPEILLKVKTNNFLIQNVNEEENEDDIKDSKGEKDNKASEEEMKAIKRKKIEQEMLMSIAHKKTGPSTNTIRRREFEEMMLKEMMGGNNSKENSSECNSFETE